MLGVNLQHNIEDFLTFKFNFNLNMFIENCFLTFLPQKKVASHFLYLIYKGYRFFWVPVRNIGMKKIVYICHRIEAKQRSCGKYRPFFEFLYFSQWRVKFPICYTSLFPIPQCKSDIGPKNCPILYIGQTKCPLLHIGPEK